MPLWPTAFPFSTEYDPAEDPPGSIDPLGTLSCAERLADLLFPGFTARMYRLRLLTIAVVAAAVAERVAEGAEDGDGARLGARLAFERLVVAALVRQRVQGVLPPVATRRLPGSYLAQQALSAKEPLTPANFLRGQAVNGASGVIMRLARNLRLLDDRGAMTGLGRELLLIWANEQRLRGVLDEPGDSQRLGAEWMRDVAKAASSNVSDGIWPGPGQNLWDRLAGPLRLDGADVGERAFLRTQLMSGSPVRARMLELLSEPNVASIFDASQDGDRGTAERGTLTKGLRPRLTDEPIDLLIRVTIDSIDRYERVTGLLQQMFDSLSWALKHRGGRALLGSLLLDPRVEDALRRGLASLRLAVEALRSSAADLASAPGFQDSDALEALHTLLDDAGRTLGAPEQALDAIMTRHERVQKQKRKANWIERDGGRWTLMPGRGYDGELPPSEREAYLHPFRVENAYAFLADMNGVGGQVFNGEIE